MAANTGNRNNKGAGNGRAIHKERESAEMVPGGKLTVKLDASTRRKRAFAALAMSGGNVTEASRATGLNVATIANYRERHPDEWADVQKEMAPAIEKAVVAEMHGFIVETGRVKRKALEQIDRALDAGTLAPRDLAAALRNVAASEATAIDKSLALSGRPSSVVEHRSATELMDRLEKLGALRRRAHVDSTAIDVSDAAPSLPSGDVVDAADVQAVPDG